MSQLKLLTIQFSFVFLIVSIITACSNSYQKPPTELESVKDTQATLDIVEYTHLFQGNIRTFSKGHLAFLAGKIYKLTIDGTLYILDFKNFDILKKKKFEVSTASGITHSEENLFFGDLKGYLYSIDNTNLEIKWKVYLGREITSTPLYHEGKVLVRLSEDQIVAIDSESSKTIWIYRYDVPNLTLRGNSNLVVVNNLLYASLGNGELVGLDIDTGQVGQRIDFKLESIQEYGIDNIKDINADILEVDGMLFVNGFNSKLKVIQGLLGREIWDVEFSGYTKPTVDNNNLYISNTYGEVYAFRKATGKIVWTNQNLKYRKLTSINQMGDFVIVGDYEGYLHIINKSSGEIVGRERLGTERVLPANYKITKEGQDYLIVSDSFGFIYKLVLEI